MERRESVISHGSFTTDVSLYSIRRGIMARGPNFTCVEMDPDNGLKVLCTLNTEHGNLGPVVAIGNGYFGIGRQIFKFGNPDAVCALPMDIKSGDTCNSGSNITRVLSVDVASGSVNIMHVIVCKPDYTRTDNRDDSIVISHFKVTSDGTCTLATKLVCQLENYRSLGTVTFWKNHLVFSNWYSSWSVIDCMTGVVVNTYRPWVGLYHTTPLYILSSINHGTQLAVFYGNNHDYYDESQECEETDSEPIVRFMATLDIVNGKLVETQRINYAHDAFKDTIRKAFGLTRNQRVPYNYFIYMPDILHLNRTMRQGGIQFVNNSIREFKPKLDDEVLVYAPTATILPIRGSDLHKDITILDSMVSDDGNYMVMLVTAQDSHDTRLQICALNMQTGKADCATIALFSYYDHQVTARLHGFINGNKAIVYSRTNADGIDKLIMQPVFNGVLDCIAVDLFNTLDGALPLEIVRHIVNFM